MRGGSLERSSSDLKAPLPQGAPPAKDLHKMEETDVDTKGGLRPPTMHNKLRCRYTEGRPSAARHAERKVKTQGPIYAEECVPSSSNEKKVALLIEPCNMC